MGKPLVSQYEYSYEGPRTSSARLEKIWHASQKRRRAGHELFMVQVGRTPSDFKPMPDVGAGAYEIRVRDEAGAFRVIYVAKFDDAVYVLRAFQKKTRGPRRWT